MGVFENDYNLPGVYVEVLPDYSYGYDQTLFGTTDPVLIIGTSFNGPSGIVMPVYSKEHASYIFGKVYDADKQQESNLVAGIHDAWDRGCRTIYACRVGGKNIYKDFNFCVDSKYKLRVSSMVPSNIAKECYIRYEGEPGNEAIYLYKPVERATIKQRYQGIIEGTNSMITTVLELNQGHGLTKDSPLVDAIRLFNNSDQAHQNNVIKLGIVDADGNDVTNTMEAKGISLGALYPGVYFIGREASACVEETDVSFTLVQSKNVNGVEISNKPYKRFSGYYFHTLNTNTDVTRPFPIYANANTLKSVLNEVGITVNAKKEKRWEWLQTANLTDRAFVPDEIDYEEVDLAGFALYERLGSGFATTAMAEKRVDSQGNVITPRIKETPVDDTHHIVPLIDGVYSMLQDADVKYRVLMCATAEASTKGKLPKAKDFLQTTPLTTKVLNGMIELVPNIDPSDQTEARSYKIQFQNVPETETADLNQAYTEKIFDVVSILPATEAGGTPFKLEKHNVPQGSKFLEDNGDNTFTLVRVASTIDHLVEGETLLDTFLIGVDGADNTYSLYKGAYSGGPGTDIVFSKVNDLSVFKTADGNDPAQFLLGNLVDSVVVYSVDGTNLIPNGDFNGMMTDDQSVPVIYAEDLMFQPNDVIINSSIFVDTTFEELVDILNEHEVFSKVFTATLTDEGSNYKDEKILDVIAPGVDPANVFTLGSVIDMAEDRVTDYNYNLYIPYKTTDNFARQFAQHCAYTELRTTPTWGFIGTNRVGATDLNGVAQAIDTFLENDFALYAKNKVGRNLMDSNNMPYPIGRNLSITFMQYEEYIENEDYYFLSNGAAGYAGMVSVLPLDQSSTNQPINVVDLAFNLTQYQQNRLNTQGIVTLKRSFTRGIVVLDGTTMAPSDSVFRRLSASRIVGAVEELIRAVAEPYIGKENNDANRNSLHTAIKGQLDELVGTLIEEYQFELISDTRADRFNYINDSLAA